MKKRLLKWQRMEKIRESNLYEATAPTAYDRFYLQKTYIWSHPLWTVELQHYHHVHNYAGFLVCFEDNHGVILLYLLPPGPNTVDIVGEECEVLHGDLDLSCGGCL